MLIHNLIPVMDIFAGPGGLGEGFSSYRYNGQKSFKIALSIEKDKTARQTLKLRSFFRQFADGEVPQAYYQYLRGEISREELYTLYPEEAAAADNEAMLCELGKSKDDALADERILALKEIYAGSPWVLIGGPPCQAYSVVGRSRRRNSDANVDGDDRHALYKEYLRILSMLKPHVFVMENVPGMLSAKVNGQRIFPLILKDLGDPDNAAHTCNGQKLETGLEDQYSVYSLVTGEENPKKHGDFVIKAEDYGVPQRRHRVILLGIRKDQKVLPHVLTKAPIVTADDVLNDMPRLRSMLSQEEDSAMRWRTEVKLALDRDWLESLRRSNPRLRRSIVRTLKQISLKLPVGGRYVERTEELALIRDHYYDDNLQGMCNHIARGHITEDLHRYLFAACYASLAAESPRMCHFPEALRPLHKNVQEAVDGETFPDRFRVQLKDQPSTTVTSHISKDGHYFIHYDPSQCRSLTVREAARLQTFPDNYFFEGDRTPQYKQVGNAVPPFLARQIAKIVHLVLLGESRTSEPSTLPLLWEMTEGSNALVADNGLKHEMLLNLKPAMPLVERSKET